VGRPFASTTSFDISRREANCLYPKLVGKSPYQIQALDNQQLHKPTFPPIPNSIWYILSFSAILIITTKRFINPSNSHKLIQTNHKMQNKTTPASLIPPIIDQWNLATSMYIDHCITNVMEI
jgi:hypothetical protein